ncbi:MAG: hypothetical protein A3J27_12160 [Candidatus Tectomicrobia bacterium RIFCSPLOWO2_12_FULL_69_37]|nr:MAG: hypothetical protein A3I72_01300 [Candidatus Tectomicrobia bacterium RIFCSPLOWO2_02_FULL_70_19]OGL68823.1 MAG: hypothetical protein A3J27_12160 [Candidatus Tectomicrobia bacterium RIFCSPLOWO2_12_FULL_69_37]
MADLTKDRLNDPFRIPRASRYASPGDAGDALPIVYGDLTAVLSPGRGAYACPQIDTAGAGTWCVAGHAIHGSVQLFDADGPIGPGDYTLNPAHDFQGLGVIATAAFSVAPARFVEAVCKGKKDASGALIENPIRVLEDLMTEVWGFPSQDLDLRALSLAAEAASALGYKAAGVIQEDHPPAEALTSLLGDFLGRFEVDPYGRVRVVLAGEETGGIFPVKALPSFGAAEVFAETARDSVVNQVPLLYGMSFAEGRMKGHDDGASTRDAASQALYGVRLPSGGSLELEWVRDAAVARAVQRRVVERLREPARVLTIRDTTLRALEIEPDDYVAFSVPWLRSAELDPLVNQIGQVLSAGVDLREQAVELRLRDTGRWLTAARPLDGSWALGGGSLLGAQRDLTVYA